MSDWRRSREYRIWRVAVVRRDGVCQVCGTRKNRHAHHKNHATYFPEQRFDVDNGTVFCGRCHSKFHNDYKRSTQTKCTDYDHYNFMSLVSYLFRVKNEPPG